MLVKRSYNGAWQRTRSSSSPAAPSVAACLATHHRAAQLLRIGGGVLLRPLCEEGLRVRRLLSGQRLEPLPDGVEFGILGERGEDSGAGALDAFRGSGEVGDLLGKLKATVCAAAGPARAVAEPGWSRRLGPPAMAR